mmetsp:Transcript_18478/g.46572  ORF Transcript_18478/g.46572 Transcript_18478/m.46572 type:complete len:261 (+) Transcript_18478:1458-2240(+)
MRPHRSSRHVHSAQLGHRDGDAGGKPAPVLPRNDDQGALRAVVAAQRAVPSHHRLEPRALAGRAAAQLLQLPALRLHLRRGQPCARRPARAAESILDGRKRWGELLRHPPLLHHRARADRGARHPAPLDPGDADVCHLQVAREPHLHPRHHGQGCVCQRCHHPVCDAGVRERPGRHEGDARERRHHGGLDPAPVDAHPDDRHVCLHQRRQAHRGGHHHDLQPHRQHRTPQRPHRAALAHVSVAQRQEGGVGPQAQGPGRD